MSGERQSTRRGTKKRMRFCRARDQRQPTILAFTATGELEAVAEATVLGFGRATVSAIEKATSRRERRG